MIRKIKSYLLMILPALMIAVPLALPTLAYATNLTPDCTGNSIAGGVAAGASQASGGGTINCSNTGVDSSSIGKLAAGLVNIFSVVVGAVAVIMIIYGGFRYITSGGGNGVGNAKNTLIYAIVGLIIVALAQVIVHFVLNQATSAISN